MQSDEYANNTYLMIKKQVFLFCTVLKRIFFLILHHGKVSELQWCV